MQTHLHGLYPKTSAQRFIYPLLLLFIVLTCPGAQIFAQGTWEQVNNAAPDANGGVMLLLSDGTVIVKTSSGTSDGIGNVWDKLTPDNTGSYRNGTWSTIAPMHKTRLYFSSQILKDGRVYVAGGEYGTGGSLGETYDPLTNVWTNNPSPGKRLSDANSEILPDGKVLQALVTGDLRPTDIYDPVANKYVTGPNCVGIHNESAWLKLPDNSILFVDRLSRNSERYIPALNKWMKDATVPVDLYDPYGDETGGAVLLPNGQAFFIGSLGHNALYTPSGNTSMGTWTAAADFPNNQGTPDAAAAMMVNGKVLCTTSPVPTSNNHFPSPTSYYEYDYLTNTFTRIKAPNGSFTTNISTYVTNMLDLPDGTVLYSEQGSTSYYIYTPDGTPLTAGKPVISKIAKIGTGVYKITGTRFNGNSEGATYGDDWQMNTNYPIVRLTNGPHVFYARTYNWNSTGVMTGSLRDTAFFTLPAGLPAGSYQLVVTANGISSNPKTFTAPSTPDNLIVSATQVQEQVSNNVITPAAVNALKIYPNPARNTTAISFSLAKTTPVNLTIFDVHGKAMATVVNGSQQQGSHTVMVNTSRFSAGIYTVRMVTDSGTENMKLVVE